MSERDPLNTCAIGEHKRIEVTCLDCVEQLRETNSRLNRRCQDAESAALSAWAAGDCKRQLAAALLQVKQVTERLDQAVEGSNRVARERDAADLRIGLQAAALKELEAARIGWIHHVCGPAILKALWKLKRGADVCTHTPPELSPLCSGPGDTIIPEGIGYAGFAYCMCCGETPPAGWSVKRDESAKDASEKREL